MLERILLRLHTDDAGVEEPSITRDRLKAGFPLGTTRRMTQLGLMVGTALDRVEAGPADSVTYASTFGETRALEGYLDSYPGASPTLFQTSIHPSAVQQGRVVRQGALREFFPVAGGEHLVLSALLVALLEPSGQSIFCGGEERGTWLRERGLGSPRSFGFAVALGRKVGAGVPLGRLRLIEAEGGREDDSGGTLSLCDWFDLLHGRHSYAGAVGPGWRLELTWM